jgi:hypothetical protein
LQRRGVWGRRGWRLCLASPREAERERERERERHWKREREREREIFPCFLASLADPSLPSLSGCRRAHACKYRLGFFRGLIPVTASAARLTK